MIEFFTVLSHLAQRRHKENQLSNVFKACFNESPAFQKIIVDRLWSLCGLKQNKPENIIWECDSQIRKEKGRKRVFFDIVINSAHEEKKIISFLPTFTLESKLGAPLKKEQLKKYRSLGAKHLIAITERYPEVSFKWLKEHEVRALRWQEVYRSLISKTNLRGKDKFIINAFLSYLEDLKMAYRSIKISDLDAVNKTFRVIVQNTHRGAVRNISFDAVASLIKLLEEIKHEVLDIIETKHKLSSWGAGYYNLKDGESREHFLGFSIYRKKSKKSLECAICFSEEGDEEILWQVYGYDYIKHESFWEIPDKPISKFIGSSDTLNKDMLVRSIQNAIKRHKDEIKF